ncbi:hypothetical protein DH2020_000705 [Rehmannia glutinosa]|uniref:AP complex mu/sigma subunit domain-containing protein n=1 Tax=Rehmannia glutinosa TaxID=99300 RepID=A0ABR0XXJ9_REHGL
MTGSAWNITRLCPMFKVIKEENSIIKLEHLLRLEGKPLVLNVVRKAEQMLVNDHSRVKEYLPITRLTDFNKLRAKLIFEANSSRAENISNFVNVDSLFGPDGRLVYKTFATLYFVFIFDNSKNELAMLDLMQGMHCRLCVSPTF